jgi:hypothetical protein
VLENLPTSLRSRLLGWFMELLPSIALFAWGLFRDSRHFLVLGFTSLLYFSIWRMYQQLRGVRLLHRIYMKQLSQSVSGESPR